MLGTGSHFGFQVCVQGRPPHTASCQAFHPWNAWVYLAQFLDYSLSSWWWYNHSCTPKYTTVQHTQLFPPPILMHSLLWLSRRITMEHKSVLLEPALCFCWSKSWSTWLSKAGLSKYSMNKWRLPEIGATVGAWRSGKWHSLGYRLSKQNA